MAYPHGMYDPKQMGGQPVVVSSIPPPYAVAPAGAYGVQPPHVASVHHGTLPSMSQMFQSGPKGGQVGVRLDSILRKDFTAQ